MFGQGEMSFLIKSGQNSPESCNFNSNFTTYPCFLVFAKKVKMKIRILTLVMLCPRSHHTPFEKLALWSITSATDVVVVVVVVVVDFVVAAAAAAAVVVVFVVVVELQTSPFIMCSM